MKRLVLSISIVIPVILVLIFCFIVPQEQTSGVISATHGQCLYDRPVVRRFHVLLGERNDYDIVKRALVPANSVTCGQKAIFRLYL